MYTSARHNTQHIDCVLGCFQRCIFPVRQENVDGLFDLSNGQFIPIGKYVVIHEFQEGLACFNCAHSMKCGFVDVKGKIVIQPQYDFAGDFQEGLAAVLKNHCWSYIDKDGKTAITLPINCSYAESFSEGLAAVAIGGEDKLPQYIKIRNGAKWGFIDKTGQDCDTSSLLC